MSKTAFITGHKQPALGTSNTDILTNRIIIMMLAPTTVVGGITAWLRILLKYSSNDKVVYHVIDTSKLYEPLGKKFNIRGAVMGLCHAMLRFMKLIVGLIKFKPHIVYLTCAPSLGFAVRDTAYLFILRLLNIPSVVHLHGGNVEGFFGGNSIRRFVVRRALGTCRLIIVITRETENAGINIFGAQKVKYFPNMFEDELLTKMKDKNIKPSIGCGQMMLLHVGWQAPEKGSLDLVEAMKHVSNSVSCDLVGKASPKYEKMIETKIQELNVRERIRLVGQKTGNELVRFFEGADMFVFPTHREGPEGFPIVILEAMAYGLPIIANEAGNIREMIGVDTDDPAGILLKQIDPISPQELGKLIDHLIDNPELRQSMSTAGRARIRNNYLASVLVPKLEDILIDLAK